MGDPEQPSTSKVQVAPMMPITQSFPGLQPPTGLDLTPKNKAENWKAYKQRWDNYAIIAQLNTQPEEYKVALFLYSIGDDAIKTYNSFDLTTENKQNLKAIIEAFDKYAIGEKNETYERFLFNSRNQRDNESIDSYVADLRIMAQSCNFCSCLHDTLVRDRIVLGIHNNNTRKRLLRQPKLNLQKSIEICRSDEASDTQMKTMEHRNAKMEDLHEVSTNKRGSGKHQRQPWKRDNDSVTQNKHTKTCYYCGGKHRPGRDNCPAWGQTCRSCGKRNHFAPQCQASKTSVAHAITEADSSDSDFIDCVALTPETVYTVSPHQSNQIHAEMLVKDKLVRFHVDCGATVNVLPARYVKDEMLSPTTRVLQMWNKSEVKPEGTCRIRVRNPQNNRKYSVEFIVVKENLTPLLGAKACEHMELIRVLRDNFKSIAGVNNTGSPTEQITAEKLFDKYKDVFDGDLGTLPGEQHLEVDPSFSPVVSPSRRVPFALKPKLEKELERLTDLGVITPVDEPTSWVSNIVVATKSSGELRVCIDPLHLNKALRRERYPIPVIEDILPSLVKARIFTKVDARNGYWHVTLDNESSKLTTFDTPFGRYRWKRLPFGLSVSSEMFQKRLNQALDRLDGLLTVHDDMVICGAGDTDEEAVKDHDHKLEAFLDRCKERGIKLNPKKLLLRCKEIPYLGHVISSDGLKPDPDKVKAIKEMPQPEDIKAVRRLCGFVNYLAKFLPGLSDVMEPLRKLTCKEVEWKWTEEHEIALQTIKDLVTKAPLLKYYDPAEELTIQCDASEKGLGAALLQNGQPIAFASRALTDTERRYAQIEKEMLGAVFALQKFEQYAYGRPVTIETDHKPIEAIAQKPLRNAPKRLQGMLLKVQKFDINIVYKPGPQMYLADTLSRAFIPDSSNTQGEFEDISAIKFLPISEQKRQRILQATAEDDMLQVLKETIISGWPEDKTNLPPVLTPYFSFRDELTAQDGLLFKGERLIIPQSLRSGMKEELHSSHGGINGCLRRARECMFWPGMNGDIKNFISHCEVCSQFSRKQQKETLMSHELPDRPWEKVGTDIYTIHGKDYLILVDYFSNFWEIDRLRDTKASTCIRKLKSHFARNGIPDVVVSDNGPQFTSEKFTEFSQAWGFEHRTSSPGHQQANGKAEAAVKAAKNILRKAEQNGGDPYLAILALRNTPTEEMDTSPAQRLLGRRTKTPLPMTAELLRPNVLNPDRVAKQFKQRQDRQAHYYNRGAKDLQPLEEGDTVRMRPMTLGKKSWERAVVTKRLDERSYEVETDEVSYRRNRVDLRAVPDLAQEETVPTPDPDHEVATGSQSQEKADEETTDAPPSSRPVRARREPAYLKDFIRFKP